MINARSLAQPAAAVGVALIIGGLVIQLSGASAVAAYASLAEGAFGTIPNLFRTLAKATPLIFSGLGVALALRAGLFNIGAEGQLVVGGLAAAWIGFGLKGLPAPLHIAAAIFGAAAAGGIWGMIPGVLKAWRGTHEVIVTIMMNYLAFELTHYLVNNPLRDKTSGMTATPQVLSSARLTGAGDLNPLYAGTNLSTGLLLALVAAIALWFLFKRTALGFEIRAVGLGAESARANGINVGRTIITAMTLSGALAGVAGAVEVLGVHRRFLESFSPGYGFDSIAVALLGNLNALGVTLSALLFGSLGSGALNMEIATGVPRQISGIVQAAIILGVGARFILSRKAR